MSEFQQCPFDECDWTTVEPMHEVEVDVIGGGGWNRLALHLRIVHGAHPDPSESWMTAPGRWRCSRWMTTTASDPGGQQRDRGSRQDVDWTQPGIMDIVINDLAAG